MMSFEKFSRLFAFVLIFSIIGAISAKNAAEKASAGSEAEPTCVLCEFVMKELEDYIGNNATEEEIKQAVEKVCSLLPTTVQDECRTLIDDYGDLIIDLLVKAADPATVCKAIGVCPSNSKKSVTIPGPQCELCKLLMGKLADMLSSNATEEEIEAALDKVCSLLPSSYKTECDAFVKEWTPTILQLLTHEVAPEAVCSLLQLCATKKVATPAVQPKVGDEYCTLCEFIMKEVDSLLSENSTQAEIEAALEKVCSLLPSSIRDECDTFVQMYVPALIQLLVNGVSPQEVCTDLKFCSSQSLVRQKPVTVVKPKVLPVKKVGDDNCVLCEFIMKEVDSALTDNATEEEITKVIENICNILPGTLKAQCDSFLHYYGPALITLLVQQLDPKTICTALHVCNSTSQAYAKGLSKVPTGDDPELCAFCEFIMAEVKDLLSKNSTEEDIEKALDDVCDLLPSEFKTSCLLFVNKYTDVIVKLLVQGIDPTQICTTIGACTSALATSDDECDLCQILVKYADDFIRSNSTEEEIIKGLLDLCSILPSNIKDECTNMINQYGTAIPGLIAQLLSPLKVCEVLGICHQDKLGVTLCSRGPAAWCATMENAKMCNAVEHCKRHVWN